MINYMLFFVAAFAVAGMIIFLIECTILMFKFPTDFVN